MTAALAAVGVARLPLQFISLNASPYRFHRTTVLGVPFALGALSSQNSRKCSLSDDFEDGIATVSKHLVDTKAKLSSTTARTLVGRLGTQLPQSDRRPCSTCVEPPEKWILPPDSLKALKQVFRRRLHSLTDRCIREVFRVRLRVFQGGW